MLKNILFYLLILCCHCCFSQNFDSYFTGNQTDKDTIGKGGICLMGGATEHDNAMRWFLNRTNGGDVLVLRASGSDGYNTYLYSELGVSINSVETIVVNNSNASFDSYIHDKIKKAEGIWFAGGDQWNYVSYWRDTPIDSLINDAIQSRNAVIGGTSAGMAIQGKYYFSAENGTITSEEALQNPFATNLTVDTLSFIKNAYLTDVITDTHFDNPDRKGRLFTFLARLQKNNQNYPRSISCNEYTAVCIDSSGMASIFGDYPAYDEFAYFIELNCEISDNLPEVCELDQALTWSKNNQALKVLRIGGNNDGTPQFDVKNWLQIQDGDWMNWSVSNGVFTESPSIAGNCSTLNIAKKNEVSFQVSPNPFTEQLILSENFETFSEIFITDLNGKILKTINKKQFVIDVSELSNGIYLLQCEKENHNFYTFKIVKC